ncbi:MAG: hypothetical protein JXD22_11670 [Sedimentisphaerales bacterium]|nr:hypothetical protein [Sedimentisphaerales bacterium]
MSELNYIAAKDNNDAELQLNSVVNLEAAAQDDEGQPKNRRFEMDAYAGGAMNVGWGDPVVVDMDGLKFSAPMPALLDHNKEVTSIMGVIDDIKIVNGVLKAAGNVIAKSQKAKLAVEYADAGVELQASIGANVIRREFVEPGERVSVNGQDFTGPIIVAREAELKEVSIVVLGADENTSVVMANKQETNPMEFEKWLQAKGYEIGNLSEEKKTELRAEYDAEQGKGKKTEPAKKTETVEATATKSDVEATDKSVLELRARHAAELSRITAIAKVCGGKHPDIEAKAVAEGWSEIKAELEVLRASRPEAPNINTRGPKLDTNVLEAAACMSSTHIGEAAMVKAYGEEAMESADKIRGIGVQEFLRLCARMEGRELPSCVGTGSEFIQAAFSTVSLPGLMSNVANKSLLAGYNYVENAWRKICKIASLSDFKTHTRYRMTADFKFLPVGPDGELKHGRLGEQSFTNKADTKGILFSLTRQMIINDDLSAFTAIPFNIGMGAAEAINDAVWTLLLANTGTFFGSDNSNYANGAATALGIDALTAAELLFLNQTKPNGRPLGATPKILLVPNALKVTGELLMASLKTNATTTEDTPIPQNNPHAGKFEVVNSSYLANASYTGYSALAWYLFADPNVLPALEVGFLNGVDRPTVERADADFNTLGMQFRGFIDFGVAFQDPRGAVKMKGEA